MKYIATRDITLTGMRAFRAGPDALVCLIAPSGERITNPIPQGDVWSQVSLPTPVRIAAGETYLVVFHDQGVCDCEQPEIEPARKAIER